MRTIQVNASKNAVVESFCKRHLVKWKIQRINVDFASGVYPIEDHTHVVNESNGFIESFHANGTYELQVIPYG